MVRSLKMNLFLRQEFYQFCLMCKEEGTTALLIEQFVKVGNPSARNWEVETAAQQKQHVHTVHSIRDSVTSELVVSQKISPKFD